MGSCISKSSRTDILGNKRNQRSSNRKGNKAGGFANNNSKKETKRVSVRSLCESDSTDSYNGSLGSAEEVNAPEEECRTEGNDSCANIVDKRDTSVVRSSSVPSRLSRALPGKLGQSAIGLDKMIEEMKATDCSVHLETPFGRPIEDIYDGVHDGPVLGTGVAGIVRRCIHKESEVEFAVKCLNIELVVHDQGVEQVRDEIYIMCQLDHPNIVRLEEVYESHNEIYLVMEICHGGELFAQLEEQPDYHYTEKKAARLIHQILTSVQYLHSKGFVHRDLKLENFLFSTTAPDAELKLIDFGISKNFSGGLTDAVGTLYTIAPEVFLGKYDERCDMWSVGVLAYLVLSGEAPFGGCDIESLATVKDRILDGTFTFEPKCVWDCVSQEAKDFIRKLLVADPKKRLTAREAQQSIWLKQWTEKETKSSSNRLIPGVPNALASYNRQSGDIQKLLCRMLSYALVPNHIQDLCVEFEKLDVENTGEISFDELKQVLLEVAENGLGCLSEAVAEDICNAVPICEREKTIRWREFIDAGSYCEVFDRNWRFVFDNIMACVGSDVDESTKSMLLRAARKIPALSVDLAVEKRDNEYTRHDIALSTRRSQMRQGLSESSRLFDEKHIKHVIREELQKKCDVGASLVMRRGSVKILSSEEVRKILTQREESRLMSLKKIGRLGRTASDVSSMLLPAVNINQEKAIEKRVRTRIKSKSDLSGMLT